MEWYSGGYRSLRELIHSNLLRNGQGDFCPDHFSFINVYEGQVNQFLCLSVNVVSE